MGDDEPKRRAMDNGLVGRAMFIADLINRLGMAVFISGAVVVLAIGWMVGWFATPWVTPKDFQDFNKVYMNVHDEQNRLHTEQLTEAKKQTKIFTLQRCDGLETVADRKACYRDAMEP